MDSEKPIAEDEKPKIINFGAEIGQEISLDYDRKCMITTKNQSDHLKANDNTPLVNQSRLPEVAKWFNHRSLPY